MVFVASLMAIPSVLTTHIIPLRQLLSPLHSAKTRDGLILQTYQPTLGTRANWNRHLWYTSAL